MIVTLTAIQFTGRCQKLSMPALHPRLSVFPEFLHLGATHTGLKSFTAGRSSRAPCPRFKDKTGWQSSCANILCLHVSVVSYSRSYLKFLNIFPVPTADIFERLVSKTSTESSPILRTFIHEYLHSVLSRPRSSCTPPSGKLLVDCFKRS